jgi:formamidopyrimidine-DNA glycosylase
MPELPEVEFARRCALRWLGSDPLKLVSAEPTRVLREASPEAMAALSGHRVTEIHRRGKWLLWELSGGLGLIAHLGMTGKLVLQAPGDPDVRWSRARFVRADGAVVHFQDPRMFGRLSPGRFDELRLDAGFRALGPDAWDEPLSGAELHARLAGRKRAVKDVVMDQTVLAGIGNIQATEALFRARIHPARAASSLSAGECQRLVEGMHWSLARTLAMNKGDKIVYVEESGGVENPFLVYDRAGEPCPECGRPVEKTVIGGRTSAYCPHCQPVTRSGRRR